MLAFDSHSQGLNSHDGFVAGKFLRTAIPPVTLDASVYLAELECHLARNHRGVTSFVSVSQNVLRVLRHTVRSRSAEPSEVNNWQVALIDLSKVTGSVRAVWETDMDVDLDGIVSADYQREFRKNVRRAFGEWIGESAGYASMKSAEPFSLGRYPCECCSKGCAHGRSSSRYGPTRRDFLYGHYALDQEHQTSEDRHRTVGE